MSLFDAISSQRAIRHFSDQPVSDEAIETILNAATRAPNGGNPAAVAFHRDSGR